MSDAACGRSPRTGAASPPASAACRWPPSRRAVWRKRRSLYLKRPALPPLPAHLRRGRHRRRRVAGRIEFLPEKGLHAAACSRKIGICMMKKSLLPLVLLLLCGSGTLRAHEFNLDNAHLPILSLDGYWRFHTGDNPAWAQPGFDDTHWSLLTTDENWAEQGYDGYSGLAWYRFHVALPAGLNHVSLYLPS